MGAGGLAVRCWGVRAGARFALQLRVAMFMVSAARTRLSRSAGIRCSSCAKMVAQRGTPKACGALLATVEVEASWNMVQRGVNVMHHQVLQPQIEVAALSMQIPALAAGGATASTGRTQVGPGRANPRTGCSKWSPGAWPWCVSRVVLAGGGGGSAARQLNRGSCRTTGGVVNFLRINAMAACRSSRLAPLTRLLFLGWLLAL